MRAILIFTAIIGIGTAVYFTTDKRPSALASKMSAVKASDNLDVSRSYRILLGIHAADDEDAYAVGSERMSSYREAAGSESALEEIEFTDYPQEKAAYIPSHGDHPLYCYFGDAGCLDEVARDATGRLVERERLAHLTRRYEQYLTAEEFHTELSLAINEPMPVYRHLVIAHKMRIFAAYGIAEDGQPSEAVRDMLDDVQRLRQKLAQSDNVIHKVVTIILLQDSLDAIAHVHARYNAHPIPPIPTLTPTERSFRKPLENEFQLLSALAFMPLASDAAWSENFGDIPKLLRRFYRPNMVVNALAENFDQQIHLSEQTSFAFANSLTETETKSNEFFSIIPRINEQVQYLSGEDYLKYVSRAFDLDVKIALVNARVTERRAAIVNPYYPGQPAVLYEDGGRLCMEGPLVDEKYARCLPFIGDSQVVVAY